MNQELGPPKTSIGFVLTKGPGVAEVQHDVSVLGEFDIADVALQMAHAAAIATIDALKGAVNQFVEDAHRKQRDSGMLAITRAVEVFNEVCAALVEKVYEQEVME